MGSEYGITTCLPFLLQLEKSEKMNPLQNSEKTLRLMLVENRAHSSKLPAINKGF
jgi:hypothetical protein